MVNGVNSNSADLRGISSNISYGQGNNLSANSLKSTAGVVTEEKSDTFMTSAAFAAGSTAIFEGIPFIRYYKNNKKINGAMTGEMKRLSESTQRSVQNLIHGKGNLSDRILQYLGAVNHNNTAYSEIRDIAAAKTDNPGFIKRGWRKLVGTTAADIQKTANKTVTPASIENSGKFGIKQAMKTGGAVVCLIFGGIIEGITEVYPTFKELGNEKGMKQLAKSSIKVIGDTAGFIAGQQVGMAIGNAIGTALFPGIGTAIGGAVGLLCGCFGSYFAGNITEKIVGKSEREIAAEEKNIFKNGFSVTV